MRRRRATSLAANPVLVGAITTLVTITAVFLAYNANKGLPFVPTFEFNVAAPNASRLVVGNEVREGGERIGQITEMRTVRRGEKTFAQLKVAVDTSVTPLPADSSVVIRPRSTLGLKYIDLIRGSSGRQLIQGSTLRSTQAFVPPEIDDLFNMFDEPTRENSRVNLQTFGDGFAARGAGLNQALGDLPELLGDLTPVMQTLGASDTRLRAFIRELADAARVTAPVADALAEGLVLGGDVFEAISRDPQALRDTIAESPPTLATGIRELPAQRPFLRRLASLSTDLRGAAGEIRRSAAPIDRALVAGIRVLPQTPTLNRDIERSLDALGDFARSPTTNLTLAGLEATGGTLTPTLRYVGPQVTVCNYWNYWWTLLADHISEEESTGTLQRIQVKEAGGGLNRFGAARPVSQRSNSPAEFEATGSPVRLHTQAYARAVDEQGNADCESGQRGYPFRLASKAPPDVAIVTDPRTPGLQGPTFTGRPRVPEGQTFTAEPDGLARPFFEGITR